MNNDEIRNEIAQQNLEVLEVAIAMKKLQSNIRTLPPAAITHEVWEDIQGASGAVDMLCDYVIAVISMGSTMLENDEYLDVSLKIINHLEQ